jgi:hypothetical protein
MRIIKVTAAFFIFRVVHAYDGAPLDGRLRADPLADLVTNLAIEFVRSPSGRPVSTVGGKL